MAKARLAEIDLPDFGMPDVRPELSASLYPARLARLRERADARGHDRLVVYADREHSASLAWLTGFDPRFEEAVLVVGPTDEPAILVGNECHGMAGAAPLPMRPVLFQDLSLPSQPRDRSRPLAEILAFKLDPDDRDASIKLLIEAGLVVAFIVDGNCAPVSAAHADFKAALVAGSLHVKYVKALTDALIAHEAELKAFSR